MLSGSTTPFAPPRRKVDAEGIPQYLTKIVSSHLGWIQDEEEKERIWDTASVRLSERSGRTARGSFTRTFIVPLPVRDAHARIGDDDAAHFTKHEYDCVEIQIHEPALTADNLGFKTWASSYVLATRWEELSSKIPGLKRCSATSKSHDRMLELGAGTGLVGIAAAAVLGSRVILTDLPLIAANLARNTKDNAFVVGNTGGITSAAVLDWTQPGQVLPVMSDGEVDQDEDRLLNTDGTDKGLDALVIVAADPIYSSEHPAMLVNAIKYHLSRQTEATVIIGLPLREAYAEERAELRKQMNDAGLRLSFEETHIGYDDWSEGKEEEPSEVECSITVWLWA